MSKIGKRRRTAGSAPDHAHETVSGSRCAQGEPEGHPVGRLLDRQIRALTEAGCIRIFADEKSGKNAEREEPWKALDCLRKSAARCRPVPSASVGLAVAPLAHIANSPLRMHG
ncbi:hypothetical protein [Streptomyces sp. NPDC047974]|uniref:hypothetical protein n=1 Tax=Streptomyces sp. NPDC047974 TaxID=3154343 RepID=UPI0033D17D57